MRLRILKRTMVLFLALAAFAVNGAEVEETRHSSEETSEIPSRGAPGISRYIVDTGPLRIRDQFLLSMGFLAFDPVSADILDEGEWQIDAVGTVTNTFAHSRVVEEALENRDREGLTLTELRELEGDRKNGIFHIDGEVYRFALAARRGLGRDRQLEVVVPILSLQGGGLDGLIEDFHDAVSLGQSGRIGQPRSAVQVYLRHGGEELIIDQAPSVSFGDIVIGVKQRLHTSANGTEVAAEALLKLPTGDPGRLSSSGSFDVGAQLLMTTYFSKSCIHSSIGVLALGESDQLGIGSQIAFSGMAAWEIGLGATRTVLLQATVSQSPFRDLRLAELSSLSTQLTLGAKQVIAERSVLFIGITENVANFNNTADIGFHLGVTTTF